MPNFHFLLFLCLYLGTDFLFLALTGTSRWPRTHMALLLVLCVPPLLAWLGTLATAATWACSGRACSNKAFVHVLTAFASSGMRLPQWKIPKHSACVLLGEVFLPLPDMHSGAESGHREERHGICSSSVPSTRRCAPGASGGCGLSSTQARGRGRLGVARLCVWDLLIVS